MPNVKIQYTTSQKMVTISNQTKLQTKLSRLTLEDAYIFQFYFTELSQKTLHILPAKVGSVLHFDFLKKTAANDPLLAPVYESLLQRKHCTFCWKAKHMVSMADAALKAGTDPDPFLPKNFQGKKPSLSKDLAGNL